MWHCLCHRLELAVSDVKTTFKNFQKFKDVLDKIYKFYSTSSTNCNDIKKIWSELDQKFKTIGKIFTVWWSVSSYNTVCAILSNLDALKSHFLTKMILSKKERKKNKKFRTSSRIWEFCEKSRYLAPRSTQRTHFTKLPNAMTKSQFSWCPTRYHW